jgi:hypothetical protein
MVNQLLEWNTNYQILFYIFNINQLILTYQILSLKKYFEDEMPKEKKGKNHS